MFRGIVEEVGCTDVFVLVMVDDGGSEDVEGEEVSEFLGGGVLVC